VRERTLGCGIIGTQEDSTMSAEPITVAHDPTPAADHHGATVSIPRTQEEKHEFLCRLSEFRAYLKAKYGTFDDSVTILARTRERHDEQR
jgi:hypothetical protein